MKKTKEEKSKTRKGRALRVPGGKPKSAGPQQREPEEVTAGFKAGKDLEA